MGICSNKNLARAEFIIRGRQLLRTHRGVGVQIPFALPISVMLKSAYEGGGPNLA